MSMSRTNTMQGYILTATEKFTLVVGLIFTKSVEREM